MATASGPERELLFQIRATNPLWLPESEYWFAPPRRWRFDFAWPYLLLAIEVEGGVWSGGRHTRGKGFADDCEKYNEAAIAGWRILRVTPRQIKSGQAIRWIERALK